MAMGGTVFQLIIYTPKGSLCIPILLERFATININTAEDKSIKFVINL